MGLDVRWPELPPSRTIRRTAFRLRQGDVVPAEAKRKREPWRRRSVQAIGYVGPSFSSGATTRAPCCSAYATMLPSSPARASQYFYLSPRRARAAGEIAMADDLLIERVEKLEKALESFVGRNEGRIFCVPHRLSRSLRRRLSSDRGVVQADLGSDGHAARGRDLAHHAAWRSATCLRPKTHHVDARLLSLI